MAGSTLGTIFKIATWGESHGIGIGVVIDGCPAGLSLCEADIQSYLDRRKPGTSRFSTQRNEADSVSILSGTFEGKTTGTPISLLVKNQDQHSKDYTTIANTYRPGHADYTFDQKYGVRDYRGGGRSSGRETIGRVAAGAVASLVLKELGVTLLTYSKSIGPVSISQIDKTQIANNDFYMPDANAAKEASTYVESCIQNKDSCGGIIECQVDGLPAGIGDPVFEKLDANLAKAILSIGSVRGFEIGDGFDVATSSGSQHNDAFTLNTAKQITKLTNHSGGTLGGMSDGDHLIFRAAIKPTPSISQEQQTVSANGEKTSLTITGRHDPIIVPRAVVVVESMAAITILDLMMTNLTA